MSKNWWNWVKKSWVSLFLMILGWFYHFKDKIWKYIRRKSKKSLNISNHFYQSWHSKVSNIQNWPLTIWYQYINFLPRINFVRRNIFALDYRVHYKLKPRWIWVNASLSLYHLILSFRWRVQTWEPLYLSGVHQSSKF